MAGLGGNVMTESTDDRGVLRGVCVVPSCGCRGYCRNGKKCSCGHPPGKHQNLSSQKDPSLLHRCKGCEHFIDDPSFVFCSPECIEKFGLPNYNDSLEQSIEELKESLKSKSVNFRACDRSGCYNAVFCGDDGMEFEYCSPKCRDDQCLHEYNVNLENDIKKFEKELLNLCKSRKPYQEANFQHETSVDPPQQQPVSMSMDPLQQQPVSTSMDPLQQQPVSMSMDPLQQQPARSNKAFQERRERSARNNDISEPKKNDMEMITLANMPDKASAAQSPKKKKELGRTRTVKFHIKDDDHGIIVFNKIWNDSSEGLIHGFLITGTEVKKNLDFFKKMQSGEFQLLDIIVKINDEAIEYKADKPPQEILDERLRVSGLTTVSLEIYRPSYALQTTGKIISTVLDRHPTHIITIVNWELNCLSTPMQEDPGIKIQSDTILLTDEAHAATCGLKNEDKFVASVINSSDPSTIQKELRFKKDKPSTKDIKNDFKKSSIIFSISRV